MPWREARSWGAAVFGVHSVARGEGAGDVRERTLGPPCSLALMAGREPAPEELAAAEVVAAVLGARWELRDGQGDPPGMHDFDVISRMDAASRWR